MAKPANTDGLHGLRWYHLGFAFMWSAVFVELSPDVFAAGTTGIPFSVGQTVAEAVAVAFATVVLMQGRAFGPSWGWMSSAVLMASSTIAFLAPGAQAAPILLWASSFGTGLASGVYFVLWQEFFATNAMRPSVLVPLSAALSAALCLLGKVLPSMAGFVYTAILLPVLAAISLGKSLGQKPSRTLSLPPGKARSAAADLWRPAFCVAALGFVWKLVSGLFPNASELSFIVVMTGFGCAVLFVALFALRNKNGFRIMRVYQVLFPIVTGAFLIPALRGARYASFLNAALMFGFEVSNLLLIITCAAYAKQERVSAAFVYAVCTIPVLLCLALGGALGNRLAAHTGEGIVTAVDVLFVCVYALSVVIALMSRRKPGKADVGPGAERPSSALFTDDGMMRAIPSQSTPLSRREQDVVRLLVQGNTVSAIARKLFISENTVRGHMKSIYRKLDVHSKQDIVDAVADDRAAR